MDTKKLIDKYLLSLMQVADYITNKYIVYKINSENKGKKFKVGEKVTTDLNTADILLIHITLICVFLLIGTMLGAAVNLVISIITGVLTASYANAFSIYFIRFVHSMYRNQSHNDNN
jgi:hypothetical protein